MHTVLSVFWALLAVSCLSCADASAAAPHTALYQFSPSADIPEQRQALLELYNALGNASELGQASTDLSTWGYAGNSSWGTAGTSYCWWWGVTCCGTTLYNDMQVCTYMNSVSGLELAALGLNGTLPNVFQQLPDLQVLTLGYNRGLRGPLPDSLGSLTRLWTLDIVGTSMRCSDTTQQPPPCPVPSWLVQQLDQHYFDPTGLECPVLTFAMRRRDADKLSIIYTGAPQPEVFISDSYFNSSDDACLIPEPGLPGFFAISEGKPLASGVLVAVILVPALAVSGGLVLLSVALMRYLRYLKRSHDAIHLTEAWKRRNPPGLISDGNDRVLREVTLVITDVEGSTELWEWDYAVMTLAQEVHDSVMRSLIGRYCGYEVTTEGDSFTIAFHDAFDAVCWSLAMQQAMLEAEWPDQLLTHDKAGVVYSTGKDSSRPGHLLFRGLRVRVAISTGVPSLVYSHELTNTLMYAGPVMDLASSLSDLPAGGQILLGHQTFSSITPRLAELGVRLMLTESEAAAGAARAGSHHRGHHFTTAGGRTHSQRSQSMLQKAADGAAALFGSGRRKLGPPLPHEDDMDESHHGGFASSNFKPGQQQQDSQDELSLHDPNSNSKAADGAPIHLQDSTLGSEAPALPHVLVPGSAGMTGQIHQVISANPAAPSVAPNGISSCQDLEAPAAASAPAKGGNSNGHEGWWPSWLRARGSGYAARGPGSVSRSRGGSGGGHSSGGLSLQHSSSSRLMVDPEKSLAGVHRHSVDKDARGLFTVSTAGRHNTQTGVTIQDNEHIPMVIDLGSHWVDGLGNAGLPGGNPTAALQGIRLTQIVTRQLAPRATHFPPLKTTRQIYPSFFQAPSACEALLPDGLLFSNGRLPVVTIAFCAPDQAGLRSVEGTSRRAAKQALEMFCSAVRTTLNACNGYECQEKDGIFMVAFSDAASALEWACLLNLALMCIHWAPEILAAPGGREVHGPSGELIYRGVRARVGIYKGEITRIIPHRATGRADYFGPPVNRAARFLAASAPGQVLAERTLVEECVRLWAADDLQTKLLRRATLLQQSFTDSLGSRRLSNTSTVVGSAAPADTAGCSEAGDAAAAAAAAAAGLAHAQPAKSQDLCAALSSQPTSTLLQPEQQTAGVSATIPTTAAAAEVVDADATWASSSGGGAADSSSDGGRKLPKSSFSFGLRQGAGLSPDRQESCQLVFSARDRQQSSQTALSARDRQQSSQPALSARDRQQSSQLLLSARDRQQWSQLVISARDRQQLSQLALSARDRQQSSQLVLSARDRQESRRQSRSARESLCELRQDQLQQQQLPDPLQSVQQQHAQSLRTRSQRVLLLQQAQEQQELQQARKSQVDREPGFGSPFSSADKLPEPSAGSVSAAAAAAAAAAVAGGGSDGDTSGLPLGWEGHYSAPMQGREGSGSSTESARMARQATLSTMLNMPASGATSRARSGHDSCQLSSASSGDASAAAAEGVSAKAGSAVSGSGSNLTRLYRSTSSSKMLPTLFEGFMQQQGQQGQHMQQAQAAAGAERYSESAVLSPAASAAATAAASSRLPSDPAVSILSGGTRQPSTRYMSEISMPLQEELYAGFEDASSSDSDTEGAGRRRTSDYATFMVPPDDPLSATPSFTRRLRSMFNMRSGRSLSSSGSMDEGAAGVPAIHQRHSSTSISAGSGGGRKWMLSSPGSMLRTFSTFAGSSSARLMRQSGGPSNAPSRMGRASLDYSEPSELRMASLRRRNPSVTRSGVSGTSAAAALAAAVYRDGSLCRTVSPYLQSFPDGGMDGAVGMAAAAGAVPAGSGQLSTRSSMVAPVASRTSTAELPASPEDVHLQQQGQQQQQLSAALGDQLAQGPPSARRLSWAEPSSGTATAATRAQFPQQLLQEQHMAWEAFAEGQGAGAGRCFSWAETGAHAAAATPRNQQQRWAPGLYGLLQEVQSAPVSPEQLLLGPQPSLQESAAGSSAGWQPSPSTQQQQQLQPSPLQQKQAAGMQGEGPQPGPLLQQAVVTPSGPLTDPQLRVKVIAKSVVQGGPLPGVLANKQSGSPAYGSPSSSSAFAPVASLCWDHTTPRSECDALPPTLSGRLSSVSYQQLPERVAAPAASGGLAASASVSAGAAGAAPGLQQSSSAGAGSTGPEQGLRQQQPIKQRSPQERRQSEEGRQVPRQLSMPSCGSGAGAAATPAGAASLAQAASSQSGGVFGRQLSLSLYGGQAPGELLTGALPLEALPGLRVGKLHRHQSFMLQAIKDQVHRTSVQRRVPMRLQVYDIGIWMFKGISGAHPVVVLLPSRLAGRMVHASVKKSSKAVCVEPSEGLLHEFWVETINMDTILLDPELLLSAGIGGQGQAQSGTGGVAPAGAPTAAPSMAASLAASLAGAESGRVGGAGGSLSLDGGLGTPRQSVGVQ